MPTSEPHPTMIFISRFMNAIRSFFRIFTAPVRGLMFTLRTFMVNNPAAQARRGMRQASTQMRYIASVPRNLGNRLIPARFRIKQRKGGKGGKGATADESAYVENQGRKRQRGRRVRGLARRAAFTQVHLVERGSGERQIVHIGSTIGSTVNDLVLNPEATLPVRLEFTQEGSTVMLRLLAAPKETEVWIDGQPVTGNTPLRHESVLTVGQRVFDCELLAFERVPVITRVDAAWDTNIGPMRDTNQDAIGIYQHPQAYLFTIADGVGGGYAGDEVSAFATKYMLSVFQRNIAYDLSWVDVFAKGYDYVNAEVRHFVARAPHPAGTTLTSVLIRNWTATVAHVGDSRVYLLRGTLLRQLTTDHNAVVEVETRDRHGYPVTKARDVLQRAVGKSDSIEPDIFTVGLQPEDLLLLVTDGITKRVSDEELYEILSTQRLDKIPAALVELANSRDNNDNASALVVEIMAEAYSRDVWLAEPSERVYTGGRSWYLKLSKPQEMNTVYSIMTQTGCFLLIVALFAFGVFWSGRQVQRFVRGELGNQQAGAVQAAEESTLPASAPGTSSETPAASLTLTVDGARLTMTADPRNSSVTATATTTATFVPTSTPRPSATPAPSATFAPTVTRIPPTSTLRP